MRVVMISKALVVGAYQKKLEALAQYPDLHLTAIVPPYWQEGGRTHLERAYTRGYDLLVAPMAYNGHFHIHFYPELPRYLAALKPDLVHIDEEAYNVATFQALWHSRRRGAKTVFFTWQNLNRGLPPPFSLIEQYTFRHVDAAIAGNAEAVEVLRQKGFAGEIRIIPQFGFDSDLYRPLPEVRAQQEGRPFTIGYLGRFVEQKGVLLLLDAFAGLPEEYRLVLVGRGPLQGELERRIKEPEFSERVRLVSAISSIEVPNLLATLDTLVLPSLTRPNWKEQFGRTLVEAMACEVSVLASDSGELPNVVGDAGLIFTEGDMAALRWGLLELGTRPELRRELAARGRRRFLANYTQQQIARATYELYSDIVVEK